MKTMAMGKMRIAWSRQTEVPSLFVFPDRSWVWYSLVYAICDGAEMGTLDVDAGFHLEFRLLESYGVCEDSYIPRYFLLNSFQIYVFARFCSVPLSVCKMGFPLLLVVEKHRLVFVFTQLYLAVHVPTGVETPPERGNGASSHVSYSSCISPPTPPLSRIQSTK